MDYMEPCHSSYIIMNCYTNNCLISYLDVCAPERRVGVRRLAAIQVVGSSCQKAKTIIVLLNYASFLISIDTY